MYSATVLHNAFKKFSLTCTILRASGNGMHSTIITASFTVVGGSTTFKSATVGKDLFLFGGSLLAFLMHQRNYVL